MSSATSTERFERRLIWLAGGGVLVAGWIGVLSINHWRLTAPVFFLCLGWAALIGAWHLCGGPSVVVNAGTTMTADALSGDGVFLGGVIVAGVDLMRDALVRSTAGLGPEEGSYTYFPVTTADAIMSGAVNALAGAVERMQRFMREAGEAAPRVVLSGGAAPVVERALNGAVEVVDNLVLEGLIRIALDRHSPPTG